MTTTYEKLQLIMTQNDLLFDGLSYDLEDAFKEWLPSNMHVYEAFIKYARELRTLHQKKKYSANAIYQRLRWETLVSSTVDTHFKLSNTQIPYIARLAMVAETSLIGFFYIRKDPRYQRYETQRCSRTKLFEEKGQK